MAELRRSHEHRRAGIFQICRRQQRQIVGSTSRNEHGAPGLLQQAHDSRNQTSRRSRDDDQRGSDLEGAQRDLIDERAETHTETIRRKDLAEHSVTEPPEASRRGQHPLCIPRDLGECQ